MTGEGSSLAHHLDRHCLSRSDGVALAWYQQANAGKTVLFQHGLGGDHLQCLDAFPDTDRFRMTTLECRGHGASGIADPGAVSLALYADDLIDLIETKLKPPIPLGGISMGAALSLRIAALRPDLVSALILVRPAWALSAGPPNMLPIQMIGELLTSRCVDAARTEFIHSDIHAQLVENAAENLVSLMAFFDRTDARQFGHVLKAISRDGPGIEDQLPDNWQIPTRVLATHDDHVHPVALADVLAKRLNAGDVVHLTPKQIDRDAYKLDLNSAILTFLDELNP